jgi:hypothetical protein
MVTWSLYSLKLFILQLQKLVLLFDLFQSLKEVVLVLFGLNNLILISSSLGCGLQEVVAATFTGYMKQER